MNKQEKIEGYELLNLQLKALLSEQNYTLSNLANASSLLWNFLPEQVYTGFYLYNGDKLILGPFQGSVSCVEIVMGKGVCGEAAQTRQTMIVEDVKKHKNYISCDGRAMSEIVVPMVKDGNLVGVLDLDSSEVGFYDEIDQKYLEEFASILCDMTDFKFFEVG
ncbi:Nif-specific regulatory protein, nifA [Lactococcus cremoris]|uniref:GAF domain-containing protein n=1 Tax=Lactococcus lactis subsp. cremoris TaxID=1359 RepID=UPI000629FDE4|nr:GAF domain-containing protein [Lactococcus cremoris]KKW70348.1 Nif-specific regulatory protein, nifA [Lactococcus cremoris]RDG21716.1 GAF domain-containing protein [Lactococcus cremoris]